ncbi:carboxypeptidase-like regulatory domain-containing protein [Winogradskyella sp.]|uniref:carboxypeptidase-like regulatory domain-containing protein n=1 Tax=Winogradskyella sp. TaxID=1883156 RepID=UPI001B044275|nr:carboxypeptidase-like regulatory domain-containing protein [Winogradskyella sp.]MBO6880175.1 carboxypeptidase-like regulatory domain-containing protein [Winogradskyella sp.]
MRQFFLVLSLLFFNTLLFGQTLEGKVYDSKSTVKDIKVVNKTQNRLTVTDKDGNFSIVAKVNDTIAFESIFYHQKTVVLTQTHFEEPNVFELKKITNELDEVEVKAEPEQPVFEVETYNVELHNLIKEDIKNNPGLYQPAGATYGVDFVYLIGQVVKLFKRKKEKLHEYTPITYKQMDSLFSTSSFFNKRLVTENLNIPEDKTKLFYDFCSAKGISSELLKDEKKMELLEALVLNSQLFLILLEEYGEDNVSKD